MNKNLGLLLQLEDLVLRREIVASARPVPEKSHRLEHSVQTVCRRRQLTPMEVQAAQRHLHLVREIIPAEVLALYDDMKGTEADVLTSPELFAMSVRVAAYRSLAPHQRQQMLRRFRPSRIRTPLLGHHETRAATRVRRCYPCALSRRFAG